MVRHQPLAWQGHGRMGALSKPFVIDSTVGATRSRQATL